MFSFIITENNSKNRNRLNPCTYIFKHGIPFLAIFLRFAQKQPQHWHLWNIPVCNACFFIKKVNTSFAPVFSQFSWIFKLVKKYLLFRLIGFVFILLQLPLPDSS